MFDTMTSTKIIGGLCGALLVFLLGKWVAELMYHDSGPANGVQGYLIEVEEEETGDAEEPEIDFATLFETANLVKGEKAFGKCRSCHKLEDGVNGTGPHLYNIVGRDVGAVDGFGYSGALDQVGPVWDAETLYNFLENPKAYAKGTSMSFAGLKKPEDRANLVAYLMSNPG